MENKKSPNIGSIIVGAVVYLSIVCLSAAALAQDVSKNITIVVPKQPAVVDSCSMSSGEIGVIVKENVVETMTRLDPKNSEVLPQLALSWTQVNPTTWRFKLRQNVSFHDGTPFNANAVAAAIDRTINTQLNCLDRTRVFPGIKLTPKVVDNDTIDVTANQPLALMPVYMAQLGVNSPKTDMANLTRNPVGTGPYVFSSPDNQRVVLKRFDGYWGKKPDVLQATYVWRSESAVRASMVQVGEADIATDIALHNATNPKLDFAYLDSETFYIRMTLKPPFDDIRVRQAMNLAIDRKAFVGTILSPYVVVATQQMLPSISGNNPDLKPWPYDPERARKLIQEAKAAGAPVDKEIMLYGRNGHFAGQDELLQSLIQMWQKVGMNIKLRMMENAQYNKLARKPYPEDVTARLITGKHDNAYGDAAFTMFFNYHSEGAKSDLNDPALDKMLDEAATLTGAKRRKLFQDANRYIQEKIVPDVMLYHLVTQIRIGPRVEYQPNMMTSGMIDLRDIKFKK